MLTITAKVRVTEMIILVGTVGRVGASALSVLELLNCTDVLVDNLFLCGCPVLFHGLLKH